MYTPWSLSNGLYYSQVESVVDFAIIMEIISFKCDLVHFIFYIDIWKLFVATVFPVHEYPIQHGLL